MTTVKILHLIYPTNRLFLYHAIITIINYYYKSNMLKGAREVKLSEPPFILIGLLLKFRIIPSC